MKIVKGLVAATVSLTLGLRAATAAAKPTVKIVFIGPLTGGVSANGLGGRNSADLAVRLRNEDPKAKYHYELVASTVDHALLQAGAMTAASYFRGEVARLAGKIAADADTVDDSQDTTVDGLLQLMAQANTDLLIVSPYFVPGQRMMSQFAELRRRGVRVRVLTNSLASNDAVAAHAGYARYREALLGMGIEMYEMRSEQASSLGSMGSGVGGSRGSSTGSSRASLHAKVVVMDERILVVGSMNLDLRSKLQNSEVALVIRSRALSHEAARMIEPALASGAYRVEQVGGQLVWRAPQGSQLKDATTEPDASVGLKLLLKLLGPLAPDEML